jgi:UDP-N-acetylglucosamine 1-carboxyvinyltransferase
LRKAIVHGGSKLKGEVTISGSKNAALPILAATALLTGETTLENVPELNDVITMLRVLRSLGLRAEYHEPHTVKLWANHTIKHVAPYELVTKMRASFFIIGPILARMGLAKIPLPGGCAIGSRPVDLHLKGLKVLGAKVEMEHGFVIVKANRLKGGKIYLDFPSVGATETLMMAATLAEGETLIENAAQEPEIVDLANFLISCGAN